MSAVVSSQVGRATRRAKLVIRRAQSMLDAPRRARTADALVSSGLVDRRWLELQARMPLSDDRAAALWYVEHGRHAGASPHPLVEPEWVSPLGWRSDRDDPALAALGAGAARGCHPLLPVPGALAPLLPGPSDGALLVTPDGTRLDSPLTYEIWRSRVTEAQRIESAHQELKRPRTSVTWDRAADRAYIARWASAPLPQVDGPIVSVVMPVRNRPEVVVEAIRSAQAQTLSDFELIVVDDGSDDSTPDVLDSIAALDPRVRVVRRPQSGVCATRNAGIDLARAPYLAFLDSDNEWVPEFLHTSVAAMYADSLDVAFAVVEEHSERGTRYRTFEGGADDLSMGNFVDLNVLVCRTDVVREVGAFDPTLRRMVDYDLAWGLALRGPLTLLPFVGVRYRAHAGATDRITTTESLAWDDVVKIKRLVDWDTLRAGAAARAADRVSVIIPLRNDREAAVASVRSVLAQEIRADLEVVVIDNASTPGTWRLLHAEVGLDSRVRLVRAQVNLHRAGATSRALSSTTGATVVVVSAGTLLGDGVLESLVTPVIDGRAALTRGGSAGDVVAGRAEALVLAGGLDPLFTNEFEVDDLVARLGVDVCVVVEGLPISVATAYERPHDGQHTANVREWHRRHPDLPVPASRVLGAGA